MNLQQLLNADVRSVGRWFRLGFAWWGRELSELVPPSLRRARTRAAPWVAVLADDGTLRLWRDGQPAERRNGPRGAVRRADVVLPEGAALVRDLELPRLSAPDLRRLIEVNIDRFTPFSPDQVYFDATVLERGPDEGPQRVRLGVLERERGRRLLAYTDDLGLKVERMGPGGGPEGRVLELDFMRAVREQEGGDPTGRRRVNLWTACAALVAVNVFAAVLRDVQDLNQLQGVLDAQQPTVALALRLRRTVETERARRLALLTRRSTHEPLRILDATTRALPTGAWTQRLEWNGRALRLVGFKPAGFDAQASFHGPALVNPRSLLSDMPTRTAQGKEPFDLMLDATRPKAR